MKCTLLAKLAILGALSLGLGVGFAVRAHAQGDAYCYINEVKTTVMSNGVQIQVKADGILTLDRDTQRMWGYGRSVTEATFRFPDARLNMDKTLYNVEEDPVSTISLYVPQDAVDGKGVAMTVTMTERSRVKAELSEDRQTYLVTVYGSRTVERIVGETEAKEVKEGEIQVTAVEGLISVHAVKADIHKVVGQIAREGEISVAVDDAVQHKVSVNVQDREPLAVLRGIAAGYGLALSAVGDVYMLSEGVPADLPTYLRSGTASFPMRYLKASDAPSLLPTFLFQYVHDNPEQNAVVVTAPSQMLAKIKEDLEAVDIPPPMIMVECAVIELTDSADLDYQFRWRYDSENYGAGTDSRTGEIDFEHGDFDALATAVAPTAQLQAWLQELITEGRAEVRSHPSIAAVNGKQASIFVGSERYIKVQYSQSGYEQERIEVVPVGVKLSVRPWTGGNQEITTYVNVEVSNIVELDPETGVPRLSSRSAATTLRTRDGETIVIGGLTQKQQEKTYRRIPILGSLPIIGPLFRSRSQRASTTELVILVRPRLLDESGRLPAQEDEQMRRQFLQPGDLGYLEEAAQ